MVIISTTRNSEILLRPCQFACHFSLLTRYPFPIVYRSLPRMKTGANQLLAFLALVLLSTGLAQVINIHLIISSPTPFHREWAAVTLPRTVLTRSGCPPSPPPTPNNAGPDP
jgi:hypothetical protein